MLFRRPCFGVQLEKWRERLFLCGGVPEWLKGTGCKPVGYAYPGSNPGAPTSEVPRGRTEAETSRRVMPT